MNNISFDNPWLLFLLIPFLAAVLVPFFITVRKDNANFHNITSAVLHVIICICVTLTISGMTLETVVTETNVYVLADISYSATHNIDEVQENVNAISGKLPRNSKMGVICFGRNYQLISDMGGGVPDISSADKVDRSATDIASALRYAGNLFDDGVIKRIIVITDGAETVSSSNIIKVVNNLQENGVYVDAVYLNDNVSPETREVQIDGVEVTASTFINKSEQVNVLVRANCGVDADGKTLERTDGYVSLYRDGERLERTAVALYNGLNVVSVPLPTDAAGSFTYEVSVETAQPSNDFSPYNNGYKFKQTISDEMNVLFIGRSEADLAAGRRIYGTEGVTYVTDVSKIPLSVEEMCIYDEIALCNFDVRTIPASQMFLTNLSNLVDNYGKTLTTYGDTYIEENTDGTDEALNALADLLPVNIGNRDQDSRLVAIIIDISKSMNTTSRFAVAKNVAVSLLNILNPTDMVTVIGFSGGVTELLPPTKLTSTSVIINTINKIEAEEGTNLGSALEYTYELMPTRYRDKQVIIISDGLNPDSDTVLAKAKAEQMSEEGIVVSALGIFPPASGNKLLDELVNNRHSVAGAFYKAINHEEDVNFTLQGIAEETQQIKIEGEAYELSFRAGEEVTEGITNLGSVYGFWYNSAKTNATTVVTAEYFRDRVTSFNIPIYAYWSGGGKGKVVSFTSDITSDWTADWTGNSDGAKFLANIPAATLPDERITSPFIVSAEVGGGKTLVTVQSSSVLQNKAEFTVTLTDPDGLVTVRNLTFDSSAYLANFTTDAPGLYTLHVEYVYEDTRYEADADFTVAYYAEYDVFASFSRSSLYRLITENGSILDLDETERLENSYSSYTTYVFSFTLPLMVVCAVLFVADIIIRQLKWKDVTSFFKGLARRRK